MSKVSKTLKGIILGGLIFMAAPQKAEAIGWFPPMPWDFEIDIPGDAGKVVSLLKSTYRKVQMLQSQLNTINLDAIKSGNGALLFKSLKGNYKQFTKGPKAPGKGKMKAVSELNIEKGDLDESHYYDAFTQLFLTYPSTKNLPAMKNGEKPMYQVVHTAYKHKSIEFNQDMIVDAYLAGRVTEDFLVLVERTINRLDLCQKKAAGYEGGSDKCKFFGLPFVKVEASGDGSEAPGEKSDGNGQLGEAMNNYVVTIVYDRLMRIIEDLTATEAIYRSARQLDLVTPMMPQSSAAEYVPQKYHFAYNQTHDAVYADKIISNFKPSSCDSASEDCPQANKDSGELEGMAETDLLGKLQPIEDTLNRAVILHNLKVRLPEYKDQFRRYRKTEEIYKRALKALETSEKCSQDFIKSYGGNTEVWGTGGKVNDHEARSGISKDLILEYQKASDTTIIGTNEKCTGYYTKCPEGYTLDTSKPCEVMDENGNVTETYSLYACVLDVGSADTGDGPDYKVEEEPQTEYNDANYLGDSSKADAIDNDNRIKAESTWQIGRQKLLELTENGTLKFDPWNDQTELQVEYLRQKYRNIGLIIKSMDQGVESFKVSSVAVGNSGDSAAEVKKMQDALNTIAGCKSFSAAKADVVKACSTEMEIELSDSDCTADTTTGNISCIKEIEISAAQPGEDEPIPVLGSDGEPLVDEYGDPVYEMENVPLLDDNGDPVLDEYGDPMYVAALDSNGDPLVDEYGDPVYEQRPKMQKGADIPAVTETKTCTKQQVVGDHCYGNGGGMAKLENGKTKCGGAVALSIPDISKHFFSDILGRDKNNMCSESLNDQAQNVKEKAEGRKVAQDILIETVQTRVEQDEEVVKFVKDYDKSSKEKKEQLANKKASLGTYNQKINENTEKKNSAQQEWKNTLDRISEIDKEVKQIDERKPYATVKKPAEDNTLTVEPDNKAICAMDIQKLKLNFEKEAISGKSQKEAGADWKIPEACDEKTQEDLEKSLGEDFFKAPEIDDYVIKMSQRLADNSVDTDDLSDEEKASLKANNRKHVVPEDAEKTIAEAKEIIDANKQKRDAINDEIAALIKEIDKDAEEFAAAYIEMANDAQAAVEEANEKFEAFLTLDEETNSPRRMINEEAPCQPILGGVCIDNHPVYPSDNLQATMQTFLGYGDLQPSIKKKMEVEFTGFAISGISGDHFINGTIATALGGINAGYYGSVSELIDAIKDKIFEIAAQRSAKAITDSDKKINDVMNEALAGVKNVEITLFGKDDKGEPKVDNPDEKQIAFMSDHDNYGEGKKITQAHDNLIASLEDLQESLNNEADDAIGNIFGLPKDINLKGDTEYFVALPARGDNYLGKVECERDENGKAKPKTDCGAGRDYNAPKRPLLNLPPLREVFYYSSLDYRDTPKEDGDSPAITYLLDLKYPNDLLHKWEYLPETWLYLLARPNLRKDGKYQQTFEERAYGDGRLKDLINKNGATNEGFNRLIARAGVYPCKLQNGAIVDIDSGNDADSIRFKYRRSAPEGITLQTCQEVALNNMQGTSCYTYNKGKDGICHLLADHGGEDAIDVQTPSINPFSGDNPLYEKYSELGQILAWGSKTFKVGPFTTKTSPRLTYRPLQKNLHEYLLDQESKSNQRNSMERQNVQAATFTRNIFSSFLEAVNAEHSAKRSLDTAKENLEDAVKSLCTQIESARPKSSKEIEECNTLCEGKLGTEEIKCNEGCQQEKVDECVNNMLEGDGLAKTAEDSKYGVKGEYGKEDYEGINCDSANSSDMYASYLCQLSDWQDELIDKAENGYTDEYKKDEKGEPVKIAGFGEVVSDKDANKVKERIESIKNTKEVLEADKLGVVFITPGMTASNANADAIKNAQADRLATRESEDEGIKSMDNQTQNVPYCPIYINKKVKTEVK